MIKSNKGFTLVELIVVIAILAILAGVAIPVYNGYINKAQDAAIVTELDSIASAAQAANAISGTSITGIAVAKGATDTDPATITVTPPDGLAADFDKDFVMYLDGATDVPNSTGVFTKVMDFGNGSYKTGAVWTREDGWKPAA